ncbi:carbonic anhydrase-related protein 10-like [Argopecten irradians]|uniref:carbonic anhydrase-related protein 10-like n=1 Tax=Argopecten irradians TaxID=31199 RepID=UPI0037179C43
MVIFEFWIFVLYSLDTNNTAMAWTSFVWCYIMAGLVTVFTDHIDERWEQWWGYDETSGPANWGVTGPYRMCSWGKQQSPIDIHPEMLLFDPNLKHVKVESSHVNGKLLNTGNDITFMLDSSFPTHVNVSEGPLSYVYHVTEIKFHFSKRHFNGSEHRIAGRAFPAEMQMIGYNGDLYENMSKAENSSNGVVIISTFLEIQPQGLEPNRALKIFTSNLEAISERNSVVQINAFSIADLLPRTDQYITYDGSMTQPSCQETVTWIIFNKPTYISATQLRELRDVRMAWPWDNVRPAMPLNHRVVRTNINSRKQSRLCSMKRDIFYDINSNFRT